MKLRKDTGEQLSSQQANGNELHLNKEQNKHDEVTSTAHPLTNDR